MKLSTIAAAALLLAPAAANANEHHHYNVLTAAEHYCEFRRWGEEHKRSVNYALMASGFGMPDHAMTNANLRIARSQGIQATDSATIFVGLVRRICPEVSL